MARTRLKTETAKKWPWVAGCLLGSLLLVLLFRHEIAGGLMTAYRWISDRDQVEQFISAFGNGAPIAFMVLQILQVIQARGYSLAHASFYKSPLVVSSFSLARWSFS